jgi:hypothetical protein
MHVHEAGTMLEEYLKMSKLPQDYINFIAKGIVHNLGAEDLPIKDDYTEEDLMMIFECKTLDALYQKINQIEESTVAALGLPIKDSYTIEELSEHLQIDLSGLESMNVFDSFPEHDVKK